MGTVCSFTSTTAEGIEQKSAPVDWPGRLFFYTCERSDQISDQLAMLATAVSKPTMQRCTSADWPT